MTGYQPGSLQASPVQPFIHSETDFCDCLLDNNNIIILHLPAHECVESNLKLSSHSHVGKSFLITQCPCPQSLVQSENINNKLILCLVYNSKINITPVL